MANAKAVDITPNNITEIWYNKRDIKHGIHFLSFHKTVSDMLYRVWFYKYNAMPNTIHQCYVG